MKKYIWLIISTAIVVARTAEGGFNANSFADSLGINTANFLIGLGCAFVWWIITRTTLSANWKWFDGFNAASYVMALLFILHLTVPKWLENVTQKPQSTVAPQEYDWAAVQIEPIASSKPPVNQTDWTQFKSAEDANTPKPPEGFEIEQAPTVVEPAKPSNVQGRAIDMPNWEGSREQKCQLQFYAAIEKADQNLSLVEYADFQQKARQKQIACNSR